MFPTLDSEKSTLLAGEGAQQTGRLPEEYVQYYAAALATCNTPADLVNNLLDMLETGGVEYIERHSDRLYLLGSLWLNAIDRIIFSKGNAQFPYELLVLPPIFHQMGWRYDLVDDWKKIRDIFVVSPQDETLTAVELEQAIVVGAFLDGLFSNPSEALEKMGLDYAQFCANPRFCVKLVSVASLLGQFGWYALNAQTKT